MAFRQQPAAYIRLQQWLADRIYTYSTHVGLLKGSSGSAAPGVRAISSTISAAGSGSGGGGGRGPAAKVRAEKYLRDRERQQAAEAAAAHAAGDATAAAGSSSSESGSGSGGTAPRSRLAEAAAEWTEAQQAFLLSSPSGLGIGAEAAIARSIAEGAFDNLPGKGKPLQQEDHGAQFYRVDPLVQAVTRTMGAQSLKPPSLELRDELQRELAVLRAQLEEELRKAVAAAAAAGSSGGGCSGRRADDGGGSSSGSSSSGGGSSSSGSAGSSSATAAGWMSRWFGGSGSTTSAGAGSGSTSSSSSSKQTVESIRAGQHPGLQHTADAVRRLIQQYNSAVLADKESLGAFWPLNQMRQLDWQAEVDAALAGLASRQQRSSSGG